MDERERAFDGPRRRDSKHTTSSWKEYRQYDSYQPSSSSNARDRPSVQSIRRPTQSEYWDQRLSPIGHDGKPSAKSQRDVSVTKGNERRLSPSPTDAGVAEREPLLATAGSRSSTRERSERHRLEGDGKQRGLGSEGAAGEVDNTNTRSQRRKSESSKLRVQTATDDIVKHSDMNGYVAPASASPRRIRREDRDIAANFSHGNATPQSAPMELETSDKDTIRSGEHTPSGQTPTIFAVPALPMSADIDLEKASDVNNQKLLVKHLFDFSQSVTEIASVTIRRDTAKATMKKKEKEYERWRSQHGDYTSLAEEQETEVNKLKETTERLDEKLKKFGQTRDEALNVMARTIISASNGIPISGDSFENAKMKRLETEIKSIKDQFKAFKLSTGSIKDYESRLKANEASVDQMDREMLKDHLPLKNEVGTIKSELFRLHTQVDQNESRVVSIENSIGKSGTSQAANAKNGGLDEDLAKIRREVEPLHTLRGELDEVQARIGVISSSLQALSKRDSELHQVGQHQDRETWIAELQDQSLKMKSELRFQDEKITAQQNRLTSLALDQSKLSQDIELPLSVVDQRLAEVARELAELKEDQVSKDDLVAKEVERLDLSIATMHNSLSEMHTKVNMVTDFAKSQTDDSLTSSKPVDPMRNGINSSLPKVNGLSHNDQVPVTKLQEFHPGQADLLADYNGRLIVCEAVLKSLQHRFDNLNTADLARNMAHQMANMYPYPANVLGQLDQMARNYSLLAPALSHLETTVATIIRRLDKTPLSMPPSPAAVCSPVVPPGRTDNSDKMFISFTTQLGALSKEVTENSQELKDISSSIDVAKKQYQTTVEALKSEIAALKENMKFEIAAIRDVATKRVSEESDNLAKVFADVKTLVGDLQIEAVTNKLNEKDEEIMHELASLNGKIEFVKTRFDFAEQELRRAGILHDKPSADDIHDRHVSADKSASPTITTATRGDGESEEEEEEDDDELRQPSLGKSILSKRKRELQRRIKDSSDSDSDFQPRRKVRTAG